MLFRFVDRFLSGAQIVRDRVCHFLDARDRLFDLILARAVAWAVGSADPREIDRYNILVATHLAMSRALRKLGPGATAILSATIDTSAPTLPTRLAALNSPDIHGRDVRLTWTGSTDNIGVTRLEAAFDLGNGLPVWQNITPKLSGGKYTLTSTDLFGLWSNSKSLTPFVVAGLPDGDYKLLVRGSDNAGNTSPGAISVGTAPSRRIISAPRPGSRIFTPFKSAAVFSSFLNQPKGWVGMGP